jgi:succinate dehydrogenase / fumarate reductase iron-sulfur subunit
MIKNITLRIWRQPNANTTGHLVEYQVKDIHPGQSFLEVLDNLNDQLVSEGKDPVAFDSDCREGICGNCGIVVDGIAHGPKAGCTTCEIRMREFKEGQIVTVEPFRAAAFPVIKDLVVDRCAFDRIIERGGYVSVSTGSAPDANLVQIPYDHAENAMDAAACIGCGACVAACPNASASLFVGAKVSQYTWLPQGQAEAPRRVLRMVKQMDDEGFGDCSNHGECEAVCPKHISISNIARMRRSYVQAALGTASARD